MKKKLTRFICVLMIGLTLMAGNGEIANAKTFGNSKNGASTDKFCQGAAWNYPGSGYKNAHFRYTRGNRVLVYKVVSKGKVEGSVRGSLTSSTIKFSWGHRR